MLYDKQTPNDSETSPPEQGCFFPNAHTTGGYEPPPAPPPARLPDRPPEPPRGHFAGTYRRDGFTVERISDGLCLVVCPKPRRGPRDSDRFLVCVTETGRVRVGNLYPCGLGTHPLDGWEFDDERCDLRTGPPCRYRIERLPDGSLRFRVKHVKRSRRRPHRGQP